LEEDKIEQVTPQPPKIEIKSSSSVSTINNSFARNLIQLHIEKKLKNMIRAIIQCQIRKKLKNFEILKNFENNYMKNSINKSVNKLRKKDLELISYVKLTSSIKKLFNFYHKKQNREKFQILIKSFKKWRNNCLLISSINTMNSDIETLNLKNKLQIHKKESNFDFKSQTLEKENLEIKNKLENLNLKISQGEMSLLLCEEREKSYISSLNLIEEERGKLITTKSCLEKENLNFEEKYSELETYKKDLESTVRSLYEESKDKDVSINMYINEMNEMLEVFAKGLGQEIKDVKDGKEGKEGKEETLTSFSNFNSENSSKPTSNPKSSFKITQIPSNLILKTSSKANLLSKNKNSSFSSSLSISKNNSGLNPNQNLNTMNPLSNSLSASRDRDMSGSKLIYKNVTSISSFAGK